MNAPWSKLLAWFRRKPRPASIVYAVGTGCPRTGKKRLHTKWSDGRVVVYHGEGGFYYVEPFMTPVSLDLGEYLHRIELYVARYGNPWPESHTTAHDNPPQ